MSVLDRFAFRVVFICLFSLLVACEQKRHSAVIPLLEECENEFINVLEHFQSRGISKFDYEIKEFSVKLLGFPTIKKMVNMTSTTMSEDELIRIANTTLLGCYPNTSMTLELENEDFLKDFVRANELIDMDATNNLRYSLTNKKAKTIDIFYNKNIMNQ